jgi:hypothetical protein
MVSTLSPERSAVTGFDSEGHISRAERVNQRCLPCARARWRIDDYPRIGLKHPFHALEAEFCEGGEVGASMVDYWRIDGRKHTIGYVLRTRYLKEMSAGVMH